MRSHSSFFAGLALLGLTAAGSAAELGVTGDELPTRFNLVVKATGFPGTMILEEFASKPQPSFRYALNDCVGVLAFAKNRKAEIKNYLVSATGCKKPADSAPLVSVLAYTGVLCTHDTERQDGASQMLEAFKRLKPGGKQTIELDTCKITMSSSEIIGFLMSVE